MNSNYLWIVVLCIIIYLEFVIVECSEINSLMDLVDENRKRKRPFFMKPYAAYTWLASLFAVKIKVAVVVFTVLAIGSLFLKMFIGYGFGRLWWPSSPSSTGCSGCIYSGHHDIVSSDFEPYYYPNHYPSISDTEHQSSMKFYSRIPYNSITKNNAATTNHKRQRRDISRTIFNLDPLTIKRVIRSLEEKPISRIEEICKRRYVCESDVHAQRSFAGAYQLYFFGREGLAKYRNRKEKPPQTIKQCQQLYKECSDPMLIMHKKRRRRFV